MKQLGNIVKTLRNKHPNKIVEYTIYLTDAKEGDIIQYYKSENSDCVSLNPNEIRIRVSVME